MRLIELELWNTVPEDCIARPFVSIDQNIDSNHKIQNRRWYNLHVGSGKSWSLANHCVGSLLGFERRQEATHWNVAGERPYRL